MSSFMMSDKSIADLAASIAYIFNNDTEISTYDLHDISDDCRNCVDTFVFQKLLGRKLWKLNKEALKERYGDEYDMDECPDLSQGNVVYIQNIYQFFKTLQCYIYQCEEFKDNPPMLEALKKLEQRVAFKIIYDLPEYEIADWA